MYNIYRSILRLVLADNGRKWRDDKKLLNVVEMVHNVEEHTVAPQITAVHVRNRCP